MDYLFIIWYVVVDDNWMGFAMWERWVDECYVRETKLKREIVGQVFCRFGLDFISLRMTTRDEEGFLSAGELRMMSISASLMGSENVDEFDVL